jgi:mannose-6-phosphate isomerase-like protein (cupin superfamily)
MKHVCITLFLVMQTLIETTPTVKKEILPFLFGMRPEALSNVPFHENTDAITRYVAKNFPLYLAVHEVSPLKAAPPTYTQPHVHEDFDEVNIILSHEQLIYRIQVGTKEHIVANNTCIWIPRGTLHAANVIEGSGYFITLRMD